MQAGHLRHRITVQRKVETVGPHGDTVETWADQETRWGSITPLGMRELVSAQQIEARLSHRIVLRYYAALTHEDRLVYANRVFHIHSLRNIDERDRMLEILAMESTDEV